MKCIIQCQSNWQRRNKLDVCKLFHRYVNILTVFDMLYNLLIHVKTHMSLELSGFKIFLLVCVRACVCACVCASIFTSALLAVDHTPKGPAAVQSLQMGFASLSD